MNYDDVLPHLSRSGTFGKFQKKIYFLLCLPTIVCAFHKLAGVFLLDVPNHRCQLDNELENPTFTLPEKVWQASFPYDDVRKEYSKCEFYRNTSGLDFETVRCSEFVWDTSAVESSAVKSFELVCDRSKLRASADSMMMVGTLIGSYLFGDMSDKFGRKPTFMAALLFQVVFGLGAAIAPGFITYTVCRMVSDKHFVAIISGVVMTTVFRLSAQPLQA